MANRSERIIARLAWKMFLFTALRTILRLGAWAFLVLGTLFLVLRLAFRMPVEWLLNSLLILIPALLLAVLIFEWRRRPSRTVLRGVLDRNNRLGGLLIAGENLDVSAWMPGKLALHSPRIQWKGRRAILLFLGASVYLAMAFLIPDSSIALHRSKPLEIGQLVKDLQAQVEVLEEEKLIQSDKANELQEHLDDLNQESSSTDPARTWEALDHLQKSASETAQNAAEETLARLEALSQAETLAGALALASTNLNEQVSAQAARDLSQLLQEAQLTSGKLGDLDLSKMLSGMVTNGLPAGQLESLMNKIALAKKSMGLSLTNLAALKLIDARFLGKCAGACQGGNTNALAAFLSQCNSTNACQSLLSFCRGGVSRGRGDAPMTWTDGSSEENTKFKEHTLPSGISMQDPELLGVSRAAPERSDPNLPLKSGALAEAGSGGGSAPVAQVLPRHKKAVEKFFKREIP